MRVLFFTHHYWPMIGGIEIQNIDFIKAMKKYGYSFTVITQLSHSSWPKNDQHEGVPICRFPFQGAFINHNLRQIASIRQEIFRLVDVVKPDILHANICFGPVSKFLRLIMNSLNIPSVITVHGVPNPSRTNTKAFSPWQSLAGFDRICTVSHGLKTLLSESGFEQANQIEVIWNGLAMPDISPKPYQSTDNTIACIGRLNPEKGFDLALKAFAKINRHHQIRLEIVGDGYLKNALKNLSRTLGISDFVDFKGFVHPHRIVEVINRAKMVLVPSRNEAFGLTALQAAQMARPVIASNVGGLPEIILHGQTGLLVPTENDRALAASIQKLLARPRLAERLGMAAFQSAKEQFQIQHVAEKYKRVYRGLVGGNTDVEKSAYQRDHSCL